MDNTIVVIPRGYAPLTGANPSICCQTRQQKMFDSFVSYFPEKFAEAVNNARKKVKKNKRPCALIFFFQKDEGMPEEITCEEYLFCDKVDVKIHDLTQPSFEHEITFDTVNVIVSNK